MRCQLSQAIYRSTLVHFLSSGVGQLNTVLTVGVDQLDVTTRMTTNTTPKIMSGKALLITTLTATGLDPLPLDAREEERSLRSLDNQRSTILIIG